MVNQVSFARENEYVKTLLGRRRYLPDINSRNNTVRSFAERNAINAPIQGTAADIIKIAMVNIFREFSKKKIQSKMILQVHDELVFDVFQSELEKVKEIVISEMENAYELAVPLVVDTGIGIARLPDAPPYAFLYSLPLGSKYIIGLFLQYEYPPKSV